MNRYLRLSFIVVFVVVVIVGVALWQGLHTFVFAWVLNFMLMLAVGYLVETLKPPLQSSYFEPKSWENGGRIYKSLGVGFFRKLLVWVGWEKITKASNPVKRNVATIQQMEYKTRQSEMGHGIIFLMVLVLTLIVAIQEGIIQALWLFFLNIVLNAYPMAVQRYNRPRLLRIIKNHQEKRMPSERTGIV